MNPTRASNPMDLASVLWDGVERRRPGRWALVRERFNLTVVNQRLLSRTFGMSIPHEAAAAGDGFRAGVRAMELTFYQGGYNALGVPPPSAEPPSRE